MIRFYISIEDAECTVVRDLAVYRDHILEHRTDSDAFLDECLLVKLCGPKTRLEFDDGTADSSVELTPFSRECASLWLVLYGCRGGHYNKKAIAAPKLKRGMRPDGLFTERLWAFSLLLALRLVMLVASLARHAAPAAVSTQVLVHLIALCGTLILTRSET